MRKICAVISAGGNGEGLFEVTGGKLPKSLLQVGKKSLIYYQLNVINNFGVKDVYVSFNGKRQVEIFERLLKAGRFPDCRYSLGLHRYGHPINAFNDSRLLDFIGKRNFLWSWGDLYFDRKLISKLVLCAQKNRTSACCEDSKCIPYTKPVNKRYIEYTKSSEGVVTSYSLVTFKENLDTKVGLHAPLFAQNEVLKDVKKVMDSTAPSLSFLFARLIKRKKLSVITPNILVNVNSLYDLKFLEEQVVNDQIQIKSSASSKNYSAR